MKLEAYKLVHLFWRVLTPCTRKETHAPPMSIQVSYSKSLQAPCPMTPAKYSSYQAATSQSTQVETAITALRVYNRVCTLPCIMRINGMRGVQGCIAAT